MELVLSIALGIGLSAACGFRVFVPFALMSIAAMSGHLELASNWEWIGSYPALIVLLTATTLEIIAYYIPWLDNLMDTVATPAAVVAGVIATASVVSGMSPTMTWTLAAIAGGGAAGAVQTGTVLVRSMSSVTTLGLGNFTISTTELLGAITTTILAIVVPIMTLALLITLAILVVRRTRQGRARRHHPLTPAP